MESNPHSGGGKIMLAIAWVIILGGLFWYFSDWQARGITSVLHEKKGGYANNKASMAGLAAKAQKEGVNLLSGVRVTGFLYGGDAITAVDVCAHTDAVRHLPRSVRVLLQRLSGGVRMERLDEQSYWLYEFPNAA